MVRDTSTNLARTCWTTLWHLFIGWLKARSFVTFDACMYKSSRKKSTSFLTNVHDFDTLAVRCDSSHQHKVWGLIGERGKQTFATAQEAAYPKALCEKFSDALKLRASSLGWIIDCVNIPVDT